jgi:hypothetical protein
LSGNIIPELITGTLKLACPRARLAEKSKIAGTTRNLPNSRRFIRRLLMRKG